MSFLQKMGVKFGKNNIPDNKSDSVATDTLLQQTLQSVQNSDFLDGHALLEQDNITLPIFGTGSVNSHQRKLLVILAISGMALVASFGWVLRENDRAAQQVAATGQALMQAQRVAKSGTQALLGVPHAFIELKNSVQVFASNARGLAQGDAALNLVPVKESYQADVQAMLKQAETTEKNAKAVLKQEDVLIKVAQALRNVNQQSSALLDLSETVGSLLIQDKIIREEIEAITQMGMLTQRIGKSANEFQSIEGVNPEAVFLLGKDLNTFQEIVKGLLTGNEELGLPGDHIILSCKVSGVQDLIAIYRELSQRSDYPLHLGVTETGTLRMGIVKSAIGIGGLLCEGIGDTMRVSLTADPVEEVYAAKRILQACGIRRSGVNLVSCPTCGRTAYDMIPIVEELELRLADCKKNITVAVMGCVVNGPGEASAADIGVAGGKGEGMIFRKGKILYKVPQEKLVDALMEEIQKL